MKNGFKSVIPVAIWSFFCFFLVISQTSGDEVDEYIEKAMAEQKIPGLALAVVKDGEIIKANRYGVASLSYDVPVTPETVFDLASITKSFTATAIMLLVEEGLVKLDAPISEYILNTPYSWREITVQHLLTHTAGLADAGLRQLEHNRDQLFEAASETPLDYRLGEKWQYSDRGFVLLGMVIESVSGVTCGEFFQKHIFDPLDMSSTRIIDPHIPIRNLAEKYAITEDGRYIYRRAYNTVVPSYTGIISNVLDLAKWEAALRTGQILQASSFQRMWTPVKLNDGTLPSTFWEDIGYGLDWFVSLGKGHRAIHHPGGTGTMFMRLPDDGLAVVVLTNLDVGLGKAWGSGPVLIATEVGKLYLNE